MAEATTVGAPLLATDVCHLLEVLERVVDRHKDGRDPLLCLLQQMLQVQQRRLVLILVNERRGDAGLTASACEQMQKSAATRRSGQAAARLTGNAFRHLLLCHQLVTRKLRSGQGEENREPFVSSCPADSMNIILDLARHVEVDDVLYVREV